MRLSYERIRDHVATVFDIPMLGTMVNTIKQQLAQKYEPAYRAILAQIASGPVVHADETKGVVARLNCWSGPGVPGILRGYSHPSHLW
jgi:purine nucleoside phosphorylase